MKTILSVSVQDLCSKQSSVKRCLGESAFTSTSPGRIRPPRFPPLLPSSCWRLGIREAAPPGILQIALNWVQILAKCASILL